MSTGGPTIALSTLHIHGLVYRSSNHTLLDTPLTVHFHDAPPVKIEERRHRVAWMRDLNDPPPSYRRAPKTGNHVLTISRGEELGEGITGTVYAAHLISWSPTPSQPSDRAIEELDGCLPPLAITVSSRGMGDVFEHEKSVYDELHDLQGVAVGRCYGLFRGRLQTGQMLYHWSDSRPDELDVSVLLLELLGERLPLNRPLFEGAPFVPQDIIQEWWDLLEDLNQYGIWYGDMHWSSFLEALPSPPGLQSEICPYHKRRHSWKIVDLGHGTEKDWLTEEARRRYFKDNFDHIIENLQTGTVIRL
ncbi:hypothetical protein OBBRIDRAFT_891634 [Obba rivulosa]|uniref:Uncharacterized protein n=1 Tax=Obba rivulosa TaxID=1052685 RepID=A0A8E2DFE3_9APHY|nr:hypothetical protein OBBRIDRAFT_891634 [Obba rivulosa]